MEKPLRRDPVTFKAGVEGLRKRVTRILDTAPPETDWAFCNQVLSECDRALASLGDAPSGERLRQIGQLPYEHSARLDEIEKRLGLEEKKPTGER